MRLEARFRGGDSGFSGRLRDVAARLTSDVAGAAMICARHRRLSGAVIVLVSLGVVASSTFFSILRALAINPLGLAESERIVSVYDPVSNELSPSTFLVLQERTRAFAALAAYVPRSFSVSAGGRSQYLSAAVVTPSFFEVLAYRPRLGRTFVRHSSGNEDGTSVILSYGLWKSAFAGASSVVGSTIALDGRLFTVVGVMGEDCRLPDAAALWITAGRDAVPRWPFSRQDEDLVSSTAPYLTVLGRLDKQASVVTAQAEANLLVSQVLRRPATGTPSPTLRIEDAGGRLFGHYRGATLLLFGAGLLVAALGTASAAVLRMAQTAQNARHDAIRMALGASRLRLYWERGLQGIILAIASFGLAAALSSVLLRVLGALMTKWLPKSSVVGLGFGDLVYMAILSLSAAEVGVLVSRPLEAGRVATLLLHGAHQSADRANALRRESLVCLQVAIAVPLLLASVALFESLRRLEAIRPGFEPTNVVTFQLPLAERASPTMTSITSIHESILSELRRWPEVEVASVTSILPLSGGESRTTFGIASQKTDGEQLWASIRYVSPDYFRAVGLPLRAGRAISGGDNRDAPCVVVIDEAARERYWSGASALHDRVWIPPSRTTTCQVIGIVGSVRGIAMDAEPTPTIYVPYLQAKGRFAEVWGRRMTYAVRTRVGTSGFAGMLSVYVKKRDQYQAVADMRTMTDVVRDSLGLRRSLALVVPAFGLIAFTLAAGGVAAVTAQAAARRRLEFAIRAALGASRPHLLWLAVRRGMFAVLLGLVLGVGAWVAAKAGISRFIYGEKTLDSLSAAAACAVLLGTAAMSAGATAWTAVCSAPAAILRHE